MSSAGDRRVRGGRAAGGPPRLPGGAVGALRARGHAGPTQEGGAAPHWLPVHAGRPNQETLLMIPDMEESGRNQTRGGEDDDDDGDEGEEDDDDEKDDDDDGDTDI